MKSKFALALGATAALAACATSPSGPVVTHPGQPGQPTQPAVSFALQPARFSDLPGWGSADLTPALTAFKRSCDGRALRTPDAPLSSTARYGGSSGQWSSACAAAATTPPGGERAFFEANFDVYGVQGTGEARLTAYFEPVIQARRAPEPGFTEPLLRKPSDMISVDVAGFAEALDDDTLRGAPRRLTGQLVGQTVEPYPKRQSISPQPGQVIAYANAVDVYNLQVQGSGRLGFPDGTQSRAAFAAQNGYKWSSAIAAMNSSGALQGGATWPNFRAWAATNGDAAAHNALNTDPSYVFFGEEQIADPAAGPRGAAGVPLTAMGSIAVDPSYHPYGAVVYVDGTYNGQSFDRLLVAQDTGGAIKRGPLRGDVFMGSGDSAGAAAQTMNSSGARWWTLLPKGTPVA